MFLQVLISLKTTTSVYLTSGTGAFTIHPSKFLSMCREARNSLLRELKDDFESQITWIQGLRFSEVLATETSFPGGWTVGWMTRVQF